MLNDVAVRGRVGARDVILAGPRGIGKTAVLLAFGDICRESGYEVINLQSAAGNAGLIDSVLGEARERIESGAGAWQRAKRAFERISAVNVNVAGFGAGLSTHGRADRAAPVSPGSLARALAQLAEEVRREHPAAGVLVTLDEMQVSASADLALLAAALQRLNADYPHATVLFAGSGLPHMPEVLRAAGVTHPDRLFDVRQVPLTLSGDDARYAIVEPARNHGVQWEPAAAELIVQTTNGYPAHLQLFADHAWRLAESTSHTITIDDAQQAVLTAGGEVEERTLGPRVERLSDRQAELLAAIAIQGGAATSAEVTAALARASSTTYSRTRDELITEGDIYAPRGVSWHSPSPCWRSSCWPTSSTFAAGRPSRCSRSQRCAATSTRSPVAALAGVAKRYPPAEQSTDPPAGNCRRQPRHPRHGPGARHPADGQGALPERGGRV